MREMGHRSFDICIPHPSSLLLSDEEEKEKAQRDTKQKENNAVAILS